MIAYKGFEPGLVCRGYQFAMGLNMTDRANCAANGFHCAENPLDCLTYYPDMERSEYYLVDAGGDVDEDASDTKIACTELTILHRLSRSDFFLHALAYMVDHPKRQWNHRVQSETGIAQRGYAVVRGMAPRACGETGAVLALAKEEPHSGVITQIGLAEVDGIKLRPGQWYDINFNECEVILPCEKRSWQSYAY